MADPSGARRVRYFYDCEFIEDGKTIDLISIGILAEDGREYYAVNSDMPVERIAVHDWLAKNVVPWLPLANPEAVHRKVNEWVKKRHYFNGLTRDTTLDFALDLRDTSVKPRWVIANEVRDFLLGGPDSDVELWAWYAAYDHVCLAQLWGPMVNLPEGIPKHTGDLKQECDRLGNVTLPGHPGCEHHALADARHNLVRARLLDELAAQHP